MNQEWLEAYKRYRERKYNRDVEELDTELSEHGTIFSGHAKIRYQNLKEDLDDDIMMKKEEIALMEEENHRKKIEFCLNKVLVIISVASFAFATYFSTKNLKEFEKQNLDLIPNVGIQIVSHCGQQSKSTCIEINNHGKTIVDFYGIFFIDERPINIDLGKLAKQELLIDIPVKSEAIEDRINIYWRECLSKKISKGSNSPIEKKFIVFLKDKIGEQYVSVNGIIIDCSNASLTSTETLFTSMHISTEKILWEEYILKLSGK